jgi:hypothetical protein
MYKMYIVQYEEMRDGVALCFGVLFFNNVVIAKSKQEEDMETKVGSKRNRTQNYHFLDLCVYPQMKVGGGWGDVREGVLLYLCCPPV